MKKRKRRAARTHAPDETFGFKCAWCEDEIPPDVELFSVNAVARPEIDLTEAEGKTIPIYLATAQRTITAIVPTHDSPAAKAGKDILFVVCNEGCAQALQNAVTIDLNSANDTELP